MEIKINKKMLVNALNKVGRAIASNTTIPILTGIKLVVSGDYLELTGSDGNLTIITKIKKVDDNKNIVIEQEGAVILPAKEFMGIAKVMPDETISITAENDIVKLRSGKSNFKLNGREASEYPTLKITKTNEVKVDSDTIQNLFQKTGYCVSKIDTRPILTGVNLSFNEGVVSVVSTDAHRLSRITGGEFEGEAFDKSVTIPPKAIKEIPHLLSGEIVTISKMKDNNNIVFDTGDTVIVSRLLNGEFPDTNRLIPKDHNTSVRVNRKVMMEALERSSLLLGTNESQAVNIEITQSDNAMFDSIKLFQSKNNEIGASEEEVLVKEIEGEDISLSFSPRYVLDALRHINEDEVNINFTSHVTPFTITPNDNENVLKLVLPVRVY